MKKVLVATGLSVLIVAMAGGLDGWVAAWHGARGGSALGRALDHPGAAEDLEGALVEVSAALAASPLRRPYRLELAKAVDTAIDGLGVERTAGLAPAQTLPRVVFAEVLAARGQTAAADRLRSAIGNTRPEEIEMMSDVALKTTAIGTAVAGRCAAALPLLEATEARTSDDVGLDLQYAGCLTSLGQARRAMPVLGHVYDRDPTSKWVHFLLAETHLALGEIDQAESETAWLTTEKADFFLGWRLRGDVLAAARRPVEAGACYRRALALSPQSTWLKWPIAEMEKRAK